VASERGVASEGGGGMAGSIVFFLLFYNTLWKMSSLTISVLIPILQKCLLRP